jgi:pilus assembly protein CpaF
MAEYSILTKYLGSPYLEEININSWNDIALTYLDGSIVKIKEHFYSPQHAVDIIKRLLHHSGMIIDNATPMAQGHLPNNTRITALKAPIVDESCGISTSIRILHPQRINIKSLVETEFATQEMIDFLCMCMRYGISTVISGATSSGKTTLLNALLQSIPDNKRIFSIESGSRELSLVRCHDNKIINNVVHTLSRPSDNPAFDITQEDLVIASLRFNPDIVAIGEMRDIEAYSAVEASLTGHTVVSTVHSGASDAAHMRIALLCQKRFPIDFQTSLMQTSRAFPLVVYTHKLENNDRKIMDISECEILPSGERKYHTLYRFNITKNTIENGRTKIDGYFDKTNVVSDSFKRKLMQYGVPHNELQRFL